MSTTRAIPTAIPELDYGEPPRDKEPRRSRSRSLRSVASLVLGKQNTKPSPKESNPPAPTSRWPSISALRRSQKTTLLPPSEVPSSAGDASANSDLYTRDRRSVDMPRRRFSLSRPIRLSLNLARPAKRGAPEVESLESEVAEARQDMDAYGPARRGMDAYTHSHDLRRRLEELEVDGASTQVLAGDASSRAAGSVELSLLDGDGGEASSLEVDGGEASSLEVDGGEASSLEVDSAEASPLAVDGAEASPLAVDGVGPALLEFDGVDPPLLEFDGVDPPLLESDGVEPSLFELDAEPGQVEDPSHDAADPSHDAADPSLVQARASLVNIDVAAHVDTAVPKDDGKPVHATDGGRPVHATDLEVDSEQVNSEQVNSEQINSAKGQPTSPHVAFAEHVVEYEPGLLDLVHSCYEDGDSSDAEVGGDEDDGYHDLDDGYHGDDELLYSSDDEDVYAYPLNVMFDVSGHSSSTASRDALGAASGDTVDYPLVDAAATSVLQVPLQFTSRTPVSIPFTSRAPAAILPPIAPPHDLACYALGQDNSAYDHHTPQYDQHAPQYGHHAPQYETHTPQYDHHAPQYAAFFSESPSSYDVAMDFLPLSDLEGTPVDEAGATFDEDEAYGTGNGEAYGIGNSDADDIDVQVSADDEADLIFPDEASFPIEPMIYETREAQKEAGIAWKEEERTLRNGDLSLAPSLETPLLETPLLGPLLNEERGIWRDDEDAPLPPLQMDRLPWLDGSDEEESPLSPTDGADSLLWPPSFGAELPTLMTESLSLAADDEDFSMDSKNFGANDGNNPAAVDGQELAVDDNADFALVPTDPHTLPYLLRLSAEYEGTPASELSASPFPSPLPRSPFDEPAFSAVDASALPFASLSAQEIATGHRLVRRGRAGVVARRMVVERQSSQAQGDTMAQVGSSVQVESMAPIESAAQIESVVQVDLTVLVDLTASSPLDVFLPRAQTLAYPPQLLDFFPAPSPLGELADGMQFSESRALVRRPTEGEMAVVRSETSGKLASFPKHLHGLMFH
ncbi:hypothetical protein K523DRAFT_78583 [Schizophyllum commune Tattone D]|nr:hypothetical protein K523DRAFT_78583 [Schizophyllum commune Tattone D]